MGRKNKKSVDNDAKMKAASGASKAQTNEKNPSNEKNLSDEKATTPVKASSVQSPTLSNDNASDDDTESMASAQDIADDDNYNESKSPFTDATDDSNTQLQENIPKEDKPSSNDFKDNNVNKNAEVSQAVDSKQSETEKENIPGNAQQNAEPSVSKAKTDLSKTEPTVSKSKEKNTDASQESKAPNQGYQPNAVDVQEKFADKNAQEESSKKNGSKKESVAEPQSKETPNENDTQQVPEQGHKGANEENKDPQKNTINETSKDTVSNTIETSKSSNGESDDKVEKKPSLASSIWQNGIQGTNGEPGKSLEHVTLDDNHSGPSGEEGNEDIDADQSLGGEELQASRSGSGSRSSNPGNSLLFANFEKVQASQKESEKDIDWDFWGDVMSDYEHVASTQPHKLARAIQSGIPAALRGMTWQLMAASKDKALEDEYAKLIKLKSDHDKAIQRDLSRTFPKHVYFKDGNGPGQINLFNVVKAYSLYDEDVGYTQGLQFIVGPLLLNMPDEEAFCLLVRLMKSYDLRSHYVANMPGLQLRLFQFDRLLEELLPGVFIHLLRHGIKSSMYASQWFLTLFGYRFPLELVCCVFDMVFAEGVEAIFRFAVALLKRTESKILALNEFEDLLSYLKNGIFEAYAPDPVEDEPGLDGATNSETAPQVGSVAGATHDTSGEPLYKSSLFVREALQVKVTPLMLDQYGEEWDNLCRQQTAYSREIERLQQQNVMLQDQVRRLEASLAQVNTEHCDLVRQVVMAKLDREGLEEELVQYKMAFADLAHKQALNGSRN